jgi:hypothetical protein
LSNESATSIISSSQSSIQSCDDQNSRDSRFSATQASYQQSFRHKSKSPSRHPSPPVHISPTRQSAQSRLQSSSTQSSPKSNSLGVEQSKSCRCNDNWELLQRLIARFDNFEKNIVNNGLNRGGPQRVKEIVSF